MLDVRSRLQYNSENQRLVAREADHLQLEMMAQQTQTKMKVYTYCSVATNWSSWGRGGEGRRIVSIKFCESVTFK